jgi:hypothetical protein
MTVIVHATGPKGSRATKVNYEVTSVRRGKTGKKAIVETSNGDRFFFPFEILPDLTAAAVMSATEDEVD